MINDKPFKWKNKKEIWIMVFGEETYNQLWKDIAEKILEKYKVDNETTKREIIYTNNIYDARNFWEWLLKTEKVFKTMRIMKKYLH